MDSGADAFSKGEERLQKLSAKPSEILRRQFRVTPYPHEPTGWIIENTGPEVCLFSSDFPHVEGGRNPMKRFGDALKDTPETEGFDRGEPARASLVRDAARTAIRPVLAEQFPGVPLDLFRPHRWRDDVVTLGTVPESLGRPAAKRNADPIAPPAATMIICPNMRRPLTPCADGVNQTPVVSPVAPRNS